MNERRAHILELVTEGYIQSAHPVASAQVALRLGMSSATVRNDFCALEEAGYLQQPHTSAGRVPTSLAYRHYASKFIPPGHLAAQQRQMVAQRLRGSHGDLFLQRVADATADLSNYAVVVSLPADDTLQALEIHLSVVSSTQLLAVVVLENGLIRQVAVEVDPAPSDEVLRDAERNLRQLALPVGDLSEGLSDIARRAEASLASTLTALAEALSDINPPRLFSQGLRHLLSEPESADPKFVRTVIERVESPDTSAGDDLVVVFDDEIASVTARLPFGGGFGSLTILGPMRMRYKESLTVAHGVTRMVAAQLEQAPLN